MDKTFKFDPYKALKSILEITSEHIGNDFIKVTANEIKKLFQADLVFITKAIDFNPTTKVEVIYSTSNIIPSKFKLEDTPCKLVFNNKIVKINENVNKLFKKEKNTDFESFYGIPINNQQNTCIGHIAILSKKKRVLPEELKDIALIYSRKIQRETKRLELEAENENIRKKLELLTITDSLTDLYNRRYFTKVCNDIFLQVKRGYTKAILAYIDIDNFKTINDKFGHDGGDKTLKQFSHVLQKHSRKAIDSLFRVGGEEFCIISINSSLKQARKHLLRIMEKTKKEFEHTKFGAITLSIGLVKFSKKYNNYDELITIADKRMYRAKNSGKDIIISKDS